MTPGTTTGMLTDRYELTMLSSFVADGSVHHPAVFEAFSRRLPAGRPPECQHSPLIACVAQQGAAAPDHRGCHTHMSQLNPNFKGVSRHPLCPARYKGKT